MNTETGRIYPPDEFMQRLDPGILDEHQAAFERACAAGEIVPVSDTVAQKVLLGEREMERRARRRKAQKQARKRNR